MAERFTRAYTLPEGLYTPGAPILIAAGALLKDNQTGQMLAQLKIKNISAKEIKATTVKLIAFDTADRKLEAGAEQQYLDLKIGRDNYFGETVPIIIADATARSYEMAVTEVVFADNTIWSGTDTPWQKQVILTPLSETLTDPELITQYAINIEKEPSLLKCLPQEQEDLWICTCGAINHKEETTCHSCKSELSTLKATLDMEKLEADKNARLEAARQKAEAEAKEKAEQAAKAKEKTKKAAKKATTYAVYAILAAVVIWISILGFQALERNNNYKAAVTALDSKEYDSAIDGFYALGDYKDSEERLQEARYQKAKASLDEKDYDTAISVFILVIDYKDSNELLKESRYQLANKKITEKSYPDALELLYMTKDYKDSNNKIAEVKHLTNIELKKIFDDNDLTNAKSYIDKLKVRDDWNILDEYYKGRVSESQSVTSAYNYYKDIPDGFLDAADRKATMAKYKRYDGEYGLSFMDYSDWVVEIFFRDGKPHASIKLTEDYITKENIRNKPAPTYSKGELKKSDKTGYEYYWEAPGVVEPSRYYLKNGNQITFFGKKGNGWTKGVEYERK